MQRLLILAALAFSLPAFAKPADLHTPVPMDPELFGLWLWDGTPAAPTPTPVEAVPERMNRAWERFQSATPGQWHTTWVRQSPSFVLGGSIPAPGAVANAERAAEAAREILTRHVDLLAPGAAASDFVLVANHLNEAGDYRTVGFEQTYRGLPVVGGHLSVRIKNDRIFALSSQAVPFVDLQIDNRTLAPAKAKAAAKSWIASLRGGEPRAEDVDGPMILPFAKEDGRLQFERVLKVRLESFEPLEFWDVFIRASNGAPVARRQTLKFIDGEVRFRTPDGNPQAGRVTEAAREVTLTGQIASDAPFTVQLDGQGQFSTMGSEPVVLSNPTQTAIDLGGGPITSGLSSPTVRVADIGNGSPTPIEGEIADGGVLEVDFQSDQFNDAVLNTYLSTLDVRARILDLIPNLGWLVNNQQLALSNFTNSCNAVSTGQFIIMFRAGNGCENTGLLDDVVFHEFGHTVHAQSLIRSVGSFDSAHSEGLSDYIAATLTDDSSIGEGIRFTTQPIRETDPANSVLWSRVQNSQVPHTRGLTYAGAMWDLRAALQAKLGEEAGTRAVDLLWFETLRRANGIPTTFEETIAADDDDGDLSNGTPNFCEIFEAFDEHELVFTSAFESGTGPVAVDGLDIEVPLLASPVSCGNDVTSGTVNWTAEDGTTGTVELALGSTRLSGRLPADEVPLGQIIEFDILTTRSDGDAIRLPQNPAAPTFQTFNGELEELSCNDFSSDPFANGFVSEQRAGPIRPGANDWQFGEPQGRSGDPGAAFSGAGAIGNDLGLAFPGGGVGNGAYQPGIANAILFPSVTAGDRDRIILRYQRWLTVEDGNFDRATIAVNNRIAWQNASGAGNHEDSQWVQHYVDVTDLVGADGVVDVDFVLLTDGGLNFGGWTIDDFCVTGYDVPVCGNSQVEAGEVCDDGNQVNGDGCETDCTETPTTMCGNGILETGEVCDDGNQVDGDGCETDCTETPAAICGNGILETGEVCDDGNQADGDGCEADCTSTPSAPVCGDGIVEAGEACDDGNQVNGDGCQADCTITEPETCDDGSAPPCDGDGDANGGGGGAGSLSPSEGGCSSTGPNGGLLTALLLLGAFIALRPRRT